MFGSKKRMNRAGLNRLGFLHVFEENRLAVLRAESTLTSKEVEKILKSSRRMVEKRERDENAREN